jgi:hypothetical protein
MPVIDPALTPGSGIAGHVACSIGFAMSVAFTRLLHFSNRNPINRADKMGGRMPLFLPGVNAGPNTAFG